MSPAFEKALAARLLWIEVAALDGLDGCEDRREQAIQAAFDVVHGLAADEVLGDRHYGPRAPLVLVDVPELAEQYNLAYEVQLECYWNNYQEGGETFGPAPEKPQAVTYSQWLQSVMRLLAQRMGTTTIRAMVATLGQGSVGQEAWSRAHSPEDAAAATHLAYIAFMSALSDEELALHQTEVDELEQEMIESADAVWLDELRSEHPARQRQA